ncbi:DNA-directed RNA polymerase I subunit RPA49 [Cryptococcus gattii E566]|uniref:DNA-directed RNA polymerase I subunit RPA49 n=2 Tax=Cryptococcus gattii TaxID=37769 RepID=E6R165_CRYGW|nr:Hypothetical Protein CGB_B6340C [Cryptococcus gattii WM276]ADV20586.1 Hypothetical Protein CGB_B6340C [Cryptococcus gattii WM276]KIR76945.1 DNA-directed RNA polymerase I subunit RPA49 [Cryptococcus gattii EJB2]KIY31319.1 DNA-directed RNA polymerase I subunit RPA49 [Cryptococcus gattii E566]
MASSQKKPQKRKSAAADSLVHVSVGDSSRGSGPAFVNFPSIKPSKKIPFTMYTRDTATTADVTKQHTLIAGETEDVEFFSTNRDRSNNPEGVDCQYLPAVYDPSTRTVHVHPSAPLYLVAHRAKRLRTVPLTVPPDQAAKAQWRTQRNDLGEAFGTRKAKAQIKSEEKNRVDAGAMKDVKGHLMESIGELEEENDSVAPSEFIPTPNIDTADPAEVYTRESLITTQEWAAIDASRLLAIEDDKERASALPYKRSSWLQYKSRAVANIKDKTARKTQMKYLYYLSCLLSLLDFSPRLSKTPVNKLAPTFPQVPRQIIDGMLSRFAEPNGLKHNVTEKSKTKLLVWICLLYLILEGYSVEVAKVAKELKMEPAKVATLYKQLGCNVKLASPAEREAQGITLAQANAARRAVLVAPVRFPKLKRRGPAKR